MFLGIFLLLFIPMLGLSIAAGINRRKVSHQEDLKNLKDNSWIDQDTILDPEFVDKDDSTAVPSKSPLSEELQIVEESTWIPSPNPPDQPTLFPDRTTSEPTNAPRLTLAPTLNDPSIATGHASVGPANLPTNFTYIFTCHIV